MIHQTHVKYIICLIVQIEFDLQVRMKHKQNRGRFESEVQTQLPISRSNSLRWQIQGHFPALFCTNQIPPIILYCMKISKLKFHPLSLLSYFSFQVLQFYRSIVSHLCFIWRGFFNSHCWRWPPIQIQWHAQILQYKYKYTVEGGPTEIHIGDDGHHSLDNSLTASSACWWWLVWHNGVRRDKAHHWTTGKKTGSTLNTNTITRKSTDIKTKIQENMRKRRNIRFNQS